MEEWQGEMYRELSYASDRRPDLYDIVIGGADNARDTLTSEGLLEEEEKLVKPAKN